MAVTASRVTVATAAVALNTPTTCGVTLVVKNGAAAVDLGGTGVTSGGGYELAASGEITVTLDAGDVLYAVSATTSDVQVLAT